MTKEEEKQEILKYTVKETLLKLCEKTLADYKRCRDEIEKGNCSLSEFKKIAKFYCFIRFLDFPYDILSVNDEVISVQYYLPISGKINKYVAKKIKLPTFKTLKWIKEENMKRMWTG